MSATSSMVAADRVRRLIVCVALASGVLAASPSARADTDPAAAEALFREGMSLLDAGKYTEACRKLADSQQLDPASGTLLALALCHERQGNTASAWGTYLNAVASARADGRADRAAVAQRKAAELEPHLSRLTVRIDPATSQLAGVDVRRDGQPVPASAFGTPLPVDPGEHGIEVTAPGKTAFKANVVVGPDGDQQTIEVPTLTDERPIETAAADAPPPQHTNEGSGALSTKTIGFAVGGVGVAALAVGGVFGIKAITDASHSKDVCPTSRCSDPHALELNDSASRSATLSTVLVATGAVATAAGIFLVLRGTSRATGSTTAPSGTARVAVTPGGFRLEGTW